MKKFEKILILVALFVVAIMVLVVLSKMNKTDNSVSDVVKDNEIGNMVDADPSLPNNNSQLANPASSNCVKLGGNLVIEKRGDGGEYGLCYFENDMACEEWALFRGNCPVGGVETNSFNNTNQKYCVWSGGKLSNQLQDVCVLSDGVECSVEKFYNGDCPALE